MTDWVDITRARMRELGLKQSDLMKALGVTTRGAIGHYLSRRRTPSPNQLQSLAIVLKLSIGELMGGGRTAIAVREEPSHYRIHATPDQPVPPGFVRLPLLEGYAGLGRGDYIGDYPEIVNFIEITEEWVSHHLHGTPIEAIRVITGRGQSMKGMYDDGDLIFIDSRIKHFTDDAAYVFRFGGRVQIKRLQWMGNRLRILSANPAFESTDADEDDLEIGGMALATWTLKEF
jgi:SOS-response transcriptional repressor LexA